MDDIAARFLDSYANAKEPDGGWMFGRALQQARLDYSFESLGRIEALLGQIRERVQPQRESFIADPAAVNFCLLLAFYLGRYVANKTNVELAWHEYQDAARILPPGRGMPDAFFSKIFGIANRGVFLPLGWIEEKLFGDAQRETCAAYVERIEQMALQPAADSAMHDAAAVQGEAPEAWCVAVHEAGFLAAWGLFMVAEGANLTPILLQPEAGGKRTMVTLMDESLDSSLQRGDAAMAGNPRRLPFQAFVYEASANLSTGRTDALVVELRCYEAPSLEATIVFPFRPASHPEGFAVMLPLWAQCSAPAAMQGGLGSALQTGVESFKSDTFSWSRYLKLENAVPARQPKDPG